MWRDVTSWCRACEVCASRQVGKPTKLYLTPIPVAGAFDRVDRNFPKSNNGKHYAVIFINYLTKWMEVFATSDQTPLTIAKLLVKQVIACHGVSSGLPSN